MSPHFGLESSDGVTVVRFLPSKVGPEARRPLYALVERSGHRRLLLDFSDVRFLSSHALGVLVGLKRKVEAVGGRMIACGLVPDLVELFRLTGVDRVIEVHDGRREALATARASGPRVPRCGK